MDTSPDPSHNPQLTPPTLVPVPPPMQPPVPPQQHSERTDVMGIISIIAPFIGFSLIGLVIGLIGASNAKRERRSPVLSRVGWIISLVVTILTLLIIALIAAAIVVNPNIGEPSSPQHSQQSSGDLKQVSSDGFTLTVPQSFTDIPDKYKSADAILSKGDDYSEEYVAVVKEPKTDFQDGMTAQGYADVVNKHNYLEGSTITDPIVTPLTGVSNPYTYQAADYEITGAVDGVKIVYYTRYIATSSHFYQVITWTLPRQADQTKADLFAILESFKGE